MTETDTSLSFDIFGELNIAVLRRLAPRTYVFYGEAPQFYQEIFPAEVDGGPCKAPWEHSYMLDFFIDDAERFFEERKEGKLYSGIWQESDLGPVELTLSALAMQTNSHQVVIVRSVQEDFAYHVSVLRKARNNILEERNFRRTLEVYKRKSRHDGLTTLLNHESFMETLTEEMCQADVLNMDLSLLFVDVDNFKTVNDTYGHLARDYVLSTLGNLLLGSVRASSPAGGFSPFPLPLPKNTNQRRLSSCHLFLR